MHQNLKNTCKQSTITILNNTIRHAITSIRERCGVKKALYLNRAHAGIILRSNNRDIKGIVMNPSRRKAFVALRSVEPPANAVLLNTNLAHMVSAVKDNPGAYLIIVELSAAVLALHVVPIR